VLVQPRSPFSIGAVEQIGPNMSLIRLEFCSRMDACYGGWRHCRYQLGRRGKDEFNLDDRGELTGEVFKRVLRKGNISVLVAEST
jgi:hypothetical protein